MLTYSDARALYGKLTNNEGATNLTLGDTLINEKIRIMLGSEAWPFLEKERTDVTVAGQQFYYLPSDCDKIITDTITVGNYQYLPRQTTSFQDWNYINAATGVQGNFASYWFITENQLGFWPIPSSSDLTIKFQYLRLVRDISCPNYTTGSIVTATNGSKTITGSDTSWTNQMEGQYIRITKSDTANTGDGLWYIIQTVNSATSITLQNKYLGNSIAAGTAPYVIGDCMVIPEKFQFGPVYGAVAEYWRMTGDAARADRFQGMYDSYVEQMKRYEGRKTEDTVVDDNDPFYQVNPNLNPTLSN